MCAGPEEMVQTDDTSCQLVVRNTFLAAVGTSVRGPRSASVPAEARLAGHSPRGKESTVSTDAVSTQASADTVSTQGTFTDGEEASEGETPPLPGKPEQAPLPGVHFVKKGENQGHFVLALEEILAEQGHKATANSRPRLNSRAKAWTPGEAVPAQQPPQDEMWEVRAVVRAAAFALASADKVLSADAKEGENGWTLLTRLTQQDMIAHRERILGVAKEALLQASRASASVYVLGHRWRPFAPTPLGFCARLAVVKEPLQACWGLLDKGVCPAGGCCRWRHPEQMININVIVKPREQSEM